MIETASPAELSWIASPMSGRAILLVVVRGAITQDNVTAMTEAVRKQSNELGYDILYDLRGATLAMSFAQIYQELNHRPLPERKRAESRRNRIAGVISGDATAKGTFVEDVHQNTGYDDRVFFTVEDAVRWLCTTTMP